MSELYDLLIDGVPSSVKVSRVIRGRWQAYAEAESGAGLASLLLPGKTPYAEAQELPAWEGRSLHSLASEILSEDGVMAALGCAALNAWYNTPAQLAACGAEHIPPEIEGGHAFRCLRCYCRGKRVATVGHFHGSDHLEEVKELRIFEKEPRPGDFGEEEEEALLPEAEVVFITGMALTNHTMPHILELCRDAFVALSGPSVPMAAVWRSFGVNALYGTTVWDIPGCREAVREGGHKETWPYMGKAVLTL